MRFSVAYSFLFLQDPLLSTIAMGEKPAAEAAAGLRLRGGEVVQSGSGGRKLLQAHCPCSDDWVGLDGNTELCTFSDAGNAYVGMESGPYFTANEDSCGCANMDSETGLTGSMKGFACVDLLKDVCNKCVDALCEARPSEMIFQYVGGSCEETKTRSTETEYDCSEESNLFPPNEEGADVHIIAYEDSNRDDAEVYFDGSVTVGEDIVLSSHRIAAFTIIEIYYPDVPDPENLVQTIEIGTSCATPLFLNDRFGSVQLVAFHNGQQGVVNCD